MFIELDGRTYTVPAAYQEKLIGQLWDLAMAEYEKVPKGYRVSGMFLSRKVLYEMETSLTKEYGKEIALKIARPGKGEDPNKHLLWVMSSVLREAVKSATFHIDSSEATDTITAFAISIPRQGEAGGSLASHGDIGERKDDSRETTRYQIGPPLSDK